VIYLDQSVNDTAEIFKALGDATRLKIMKLIAAKGNMLCVGKIAHCLNISQPAVSQHLKVLKNAGLVEPDRQGFHVHYRIVSDSLKSYGLSIEGFLKSFGAEMELDNDCELKGKKENCKKLNN
jgi:ArsR family transcriptional regulator